MRRDGLLAAKWKEVADDFHLFAVEWEPRQIRFYVDGILYAADIPENATAGASWPFDHPEYILLNLAVGASGRISR